MGDDVALDAFVDLRRALRHRLLGIEDARQRLVGHVDRLDAVQRGLLVGGDDGGHTLSLVAHDAVGQRRLVLHEGTELDLRHVLLRVDGQHAGDLLGLRGVDGLDARVRVRAAQDLAVDHRGQAHVVGVGRAAGDLLQ